MIQMMMLMRHIRHIGGVVVSFRAFLVAAYRGGGGDFFPACSRSASVVRE